MITKLLKKYPTTIIAIIGIFSGLIGLWLAYEPTNTNGITKYDYKPVGGDFTLDSINGKVSLSDFKDKYKIIYFGYTYCPDFCPIDLGHITHFYNKQPAELQNKIQVIFISVDPKRDTVARLTQYMKYFNEDYVGLTGDKQTLDEIAARYGVIYKIPTLENDGEEFNNNYLVDHTVYTYLVDKQNEVQSLVSASLSNMLQDKFGEMVKNE